MTLNMCGIVAVLGRPNDHQVGRALQALMRRGPDEAQAMHVESDLWMAHTRLSINNPTSGAQPIEKGDWVLCCNGEIYNYKSLVDDISNSDCDAIIAALEQHGDEAPKHLDGVFAYVAFNRASKKIYIARDAIGVVPLYMGEFNNEVWIATLLDAIPPRAEVQVVEPGTSCVIAMPQNHAPFVHWGPEYRLSGWDNGISIETHQNKIEQLLEAAVAKRLMGNVPWACLLSGGVDSTIVTKLAVKLAPKLRPDYPKVHTFCIGLEGSPDVAAAEAVAAELGTIHTSVVYTLEEAIQALEPTIHAIESFDVTTVRSSIPMWLLGKTMRKFGIKMCLSGEGSDELFGGYLYNTYCPSRDEMAKECKDKMQQLHGYDCLRANKSMGDWGIETRVPFLDQDVVQYVMNVLDPIHKLSGTHPNGPRPTKWLIRHLANVGGVKDRVKAQFSDAVGKEHIRALKDYAEKHISDELLKTIQEAWKVKSPQTKEAGMYRMHFQKKFTTESHAETCPYTDDTIACSTPRAFAWHEMFSSHKDASGEAVLQCMP